MDDEGQPIADVHAGPPQDTGRQTYTTSSVEASYGHRASIGAPGGDFDVAGVGTESDGGWPTECGIGGPEPPTVGIDGLNGEDGAGHG